MLKCDLMLHIMIQKDQCLNEKTKKVTGLMKDESGGKIMKEFAVFRPQIYSYLTDDNDKNKKARVS